jgi:hypothetical protein
LFVIENPGDEELMSTLEKERDRGIKLHGRPDHSGYIPQFVQTGFIRVRTGFLHRFSGYLIKMLAGNDEFYYHSGNYRLYCDML